MKQTVAYTLYHPKWYRQRVSTYWWIHKWRYLKFILRELSSLFVAWFVILALLLLKAISEGSASYARFMEWLESPLLIVINAISLLFVTYHAITWFNLAPRAMAVRVGGKRLPGWAVAAPNYVAWAAVSAAIILLVIWGG